MREQLEIFVEDLSNEAQERVCAFYGLRMANEGNLDVHPLFTLTRISKETNHEEEKEEV